MDEAFVPFARVIEQLLAFRGELVDEEAGVRTYITGCEIESPVEFDVGRDSEGSLAIGSTPPLYPLRTSVEPSYHRVRLVASLERDDGGQ